MWNLARSLTWWVPALVIALLAGIMPDTFLDNPNSTIRHEAAFVLRFWLIVLGFAYIAVVLVVRVWLHISEPSEGGDNQPLHWAGAAEGFPVIPAPTPRGPGQ